VGGGEKKMLKLTRMMKRNNKGFTLVELMVVVVIIGILVAIAVPLYSNVQESAKEKTCYANQRILEGAVAQYSADHDGGFTDVPGLVSGDYIQEAPQCKDASDGYTINTTTGKVTAGGSGCSHGHYSGNPASW